MKFFNCFCYKLLFVFTFFLNKDWIARVVNI